MSRALLRLGVLEIGRIESAMNFKKLSIHNTPKINYMYCLNDRIATRLAQALNSNGHINGHPHARLLIANLVLFIWFTGPLARLVERLVPARPAEKGVQARYLDNFYLDQSALALDQVRRELVCLGSLVKSMIDRSLQAVLSGSQQDASSLSRSDDDVDKLYEEIIRYLSRLSKDEPIQSS